MLFGSSVSNGFRARTVTCIQTQGNTITNNGQHMGSITEPVPKQQSGCYTNCQTFGHIACL